MYATARSKHEKWQIQLHDTKGSIGTTWFLQSDETGWEPGNSPRTQPEMVAKRPGTIKLSNKKEAFPPSLKGVKIQLQEHCCSALISFDSKRLYQSYQNLLSLKIYKSNMIL